MSWHAFRFCLSVSNVSNDVFFFFLFFSLLLLNWMEEDIIILYLPSISKPTFNCTWWHTLKYTLPVHIWHTLYRYFNTIYIVTLTLNLWYQMAKTGSQTKINYLIYNTKCKELTPFSWHASGNTSKTHFPKQ